MTRSRDAEVRAWQLSQVQRCAAAADALPYDTVILDGELPAARITGEVLEILGRDTVRDLTRRQQLTGERGQRTGQRRQP